MPFLNEEIIPEPATNYVRFSMPLGKLAQLACGLTESQWSNRHQRRSQQHMQRFATAELWFNRATSRVAALVPSDTSSLWWTRLRKDLWCWLTVKHDTLRWARLHGGVPAADVTNQILTIDIDTVLKHLSLRVDAPPDWSAGPRPGPDIGRAQFEESLRMRWRGRCALILDRYQAEQARQQGRHRSAREAEQLNEVQVFVELRAFVDNLLASVRRSINASAAQHQELAHELNAWFDSLVVLAIDLRSHYTSTEQSTLDIIIWCLSTHTGHLSAPGFFMQALDLTVGPYPTWQFPLYSPDGSANVPNWLHKRYYRVLVLPPAVPTTERYHEFLDPMANAQYGAVPLQPFVQYALAPLGYRARRRYRISEEGQRKRWSGSEAI
ncbi:hypothetical protein JCM10908_004410 [Rhodotorula pacifica]|uniref:uncharacterized protein n=1 Tax=Rhodotorula pacifica TaxID=1495444 RepID=UPI00316C403E